MAFNVYIKATALVCHISGTKGGGNSSIMADFMWLIDPI